MGMGGGFEFEFGVLDLWKGWASGFLGIVFLFDLGFVILLFGVIV